MIFGIDISSYDLHIDQPALFLPAHQHPSCSSSPSITGQFSLTLAQSTQLRRISARVTGKMRRPRYGLFSPETHEETTFKRTRDLASSKTLNAFTLPAGDYEFPFEISLPEILLESLTGPGHAYHTYTVDVVLERWLRQDLVVSRGIRIYRSPSLGDIWGKYLKRTVSGTAKDLKYSISIPDTLVRHGSVVPVVCWIQPLSDNTTVTDIIVRLHEKHDLCFPATAAEASRYNTHTITSYHEYIISDARTGYGIPDVDRQGFESATGAGEPETQQVTIPVRVPGGVDACTQSFSSGCIEIRHWVSVDIEYRGENLPVYVYMAPEVKKHDGLGTACQEQCLKDGINCPPSYGHHEMDCMVSEVTEVGDWI
ncbi:hypothetical protein BJX61DRAFT_549215 [Aspergillus egyptiacus]|nr:hypothetical protein BJX61DRAFT_549215 [Aspergillus egyptiacus]